MGKSRVFHVGNVTANMNCIADERQFVPVFISYL